MFTNEKKTVQFFFRLEALAGAESSASNIARLYMDKIQGGGNIPWNGQPSVTPAGSFIGRLFAVLAAWVVSYSYCTSFE